MKVQNEKKLKEKNGITLVAVVVTIVVLLILAGVSLNLVLGNNGIISKAKETKNKTEQDQINTEKALNALNDWMDKQLGDNSNPPEEQKPPVEDKAPIPKGFYYVGGTKESGLVISDNPEDENDYKDQEVVGTNLVGNQYVWIPCTTDGANGTLQYKRTEWGVEVDGDDNTRASKDELTLKDASVTYSELDTSNGINATVSAEIVEQIKAEKASIQKNGGYYIGRYEVGKEENTAVVQANKEPYAEITWSTAYNFAKGIGGGADATTYLCSSYAWDTAINFIQNNSEFTNYATSIDGMNENWKNREVKDRSGKIIKPSGTEKRLSTGLTTPKCNIYDMGGNVAEFTTELNPGTSETVVFRGVDYYDNDYPAGHRWDTLSSIVYTYYGLRATLFLK